MTKLQLKGPWPHSIDIESAVCLLKTNDVVAIPTETVYGLAARISDDNAIKKIFSTKKRPFFDPLIVHVSAVEQARNLTEDWPLSAQLLTEAFWPGPLTLILKKAPHVSDLITSGLPSVGLRWPDHFVARAIIDQLGEPIAAPSANLFGQTSPSKADHVIHEFNGTVPVVDGGPCEIGIESTIIKIEETPKTVTVTLLRGGHIRPQEIRDVLEKQSKEVHFLQPGKNIEAPGQIQHHYMPQIPLILIMRKEWDLIHHSTEMLNKIFGTQFQVVKIMTLGSTPALAARQLYSELRECSKPPSSSILFIKEAFHSNEEWAPIFDRLKRAATHNRI